MASSLGARYAKPNQGERFLAAAIDEVLAGQGSDADPRSRLTVA